MNACPILKTTKCPKNCAFLLQGVCAIVLNVQLTHGNLKLLEDLGKQVAKLEVRLRKLER